MLLACAFSAAGQDFKLKIDNPMPRVGTSVRLEYQIDLPKQKGEDDSKGEPGESLFMMASIFTDKSGNGSITITFQDTGITTVGPFRMNIQGKEYVSDILQIRVYPALPAVESGYWYFIVKQGDNEYLVTEQRIKADIKTERSKNSISMSYGEVEFAELDDDAINEEKKDISFSNRTSTSKMEAVTVDGKKESVHYKITVYTISKGPSYKGDYKLKKGDFRNFPRKTDFDPVIIK